MSVTIESVVTSPWGSGRSHHSFDPDEVVKQEATFGVGTTGATTFSPPDGATVLMVVMPTTNASGWRLATSTSEAGLPMGAQGASVLSLGTTDTLYAYSTSTRAILGVRLLWGIDG